MTKVAIVTGSSKGIGAGLAKAYQELGYAVVGTALSIDSSAQPSLVTVAGDITDPETARRVPHELS